MSNQVTVRDLEQISAYLDGQLPPKERERLETRLLTEPELAETLEQLKRTRALLRALPKVHVPRNFTLSPQAVRPRPAQSFAFNFMRSVSAISTLMLIIILVSDFLHTRQLASSPIMEELPVLSMPTLEAVTETEPSAIPMELAQGEVITETARMELPITGTATEPMASAKAIPAEPEQYLAETPSPIQEATDTPSEVMLFAIESTPSPYPPSQAIPTTEVAPTLTPLPTPTGEAGIQYTYRLLEGFLITIAIGTAIAALIFRNRSLK